MIGEKIFLVVFCYQIMFTSPSISSSVCTRRDLVSVRAYVSRKFTYRKTYHGKGQCNYAYGYGCILTRIGLKSYNVSVMTHKTQTREYCCPGYISRDLSDNSSLVCDPICQPKCTNGYCQSPGQCVCNRGYTPDPNDDHKCLPLCHSCTKGTCVSPQNCKCDDGYSRVNHTCEPVCTEPCVNAVCSAPESCTCLIGYKLSDRNTCDRGCPHGCNHGSCIDGTCECEQGYALVQNTCVPICEPACNDAICIAPNICQCNPPDTRRVSSYNSDCNSNINTYIESTVSTDITLISQTYEDDIVTDVTCSTEDCKEGLTETFTEDFTESITDFTEQSSSLMSNDYVTQQENQRLFEYWPFLIVALFVIALMACLTAIIVKWKAIFIYFNGSSYVVEGEKDDVNSTSGRFDTMKFSDIRNSENTSTKERV